MLTMFFLVFLLIFSASAEINRYYQIDLIYRNGTLSYQKIAVEPSPAKLQTPEGSYIAELVSLDNKILNFTFFAIPLTTLYDVFDPETEEITGGGMIQRNETEVALYVPYYANAKELNIYSPELIRKLTIDVSSYAKETAVEEPEAKKEQLKKAESPEEKISLKAEAGEEEADKEKAVAIEITPVLKIIEGVFVGIAIIIALILTIIILKKKRLLERQ